MKKIHAEKLSETPSAKQSDAEQLSLFEWAGIPDESLEKLDRIHSLIANDFWALVKRSGIFEDSGVGFAVRNGL
jgi:hypothetical protein